MCLPLKVKFSSITVYLSSLTLYYLLTLLPSGKHHAFVCVWVSVFLFCSIVASSFISYLEVKWYDYKLFLPDWFCSAWYSQCPFMLLPMTVVFHLFLWLNSILLHICTPSFSSITYWRTLVVSVPWPLCIEHKGAYIFANKYFQVFLVVMQKKVCWVIW